MKKILVVHQHGSIGGAGLSLIHIIKSIDNSKFETYVLCPNKPSEMLDVLKNEHCTVVPMEQPPVNFNHYNGGIKYAFSPRTVVNLIQLFSDKKRIEKYIKELSPDIVVVNSMTLFWIGKIAKKYNLKTVCFHRETYIKGIFGVRSKVIKHGLSKWFDKVAFISKYDLDVTGNISANKYLVYDRVDLNLYSGYNKQSERTKLSLQGDYKYVLYLGGFSSLKGAHVIVDAMKYIKDDKIKLIFVSEFKSLEDLNKYSVKGFKNRLNIILKKDDIFNVRKLIHKHNLQDKIVFFSRSATPEMFYAVSDLVVFPSTLAHQSRPVYEAGIARVPIIITDFRETKEFVNDEKTAITFKNRSSKDLSEKINMVLNGEIEIAKIINNNYLQTVTNHDINTLKYDIERLLEF